MRKLRLEALLANMKDKIKKTTTTKTVRGRPSIIFSQRKHGTAFRNTLTEASKKRVEQRTLVNACTRERDGKREKTTQRNLIRNGFILSWKKITSRWVRLFGPLCLTI